jgi:hypothetical protein
MIKRLQEKLRFLHSEAILWADNKKENIVNY